MPFEHILVPVDGSETSYAAVDKAVEIAKAFNSKSHSGSSAGTGPLYRCGIYLCGTNQ